MNALWHSPGVQEQRVIPVYRYIAPLEQRDFSEIGGLLRHFRDVELDACKTLLRRVLHEV